MLISIIIGKSHTTAGSTTHMLSYLLIPKVESFDVYNRPFLQIWLHITNLMHTHLRTYVHISLRIHTYVHKPWHQFHYWLSPLSNSWYIYVRGFHKVLMNNHKFTYILKCECTYMYIHSCVHVLRLCIYLTITLCSTTK